MQHSHGDEDSYLLMHNIQKLEQRKLIWENFFKELSSIPDETPGIDLNLELDNETYSSNNSDSELSVDCDHTDPSCSVFEEESVAEEIPNDLKNILNNKMVKEFFDAQKSIDLDKYNIMMHLYISQNPEVIEAEDIVTVYAKYFRWQAMVYCFLMNRKIQKLHRKYKKQFQEYFETLYKRIKRKDMLQSYIKFITYEYDIINILVTN